MKSWQQYRSSLEDLQQFKIELLEGIKEPLQVRPDRAEEPVASDSMEVKEPL